MSEWLVAALALVLASIGIVGCIIPVLPGPLLTYLGMLSLYWHPKPISLTTLAVFGMLTAIVTVLDYVIPALGAKKFHCSKAGTIGCMIGTIVGMFMLPLGLIIGPFGGAVIGEMLAHKQFSAAVYGGFGALLGLLSGVVIKLVLCLTMTGWCAYYYLTNS